ncbi:acyl-CoA N-acyltransferase [Mycena epipterygia]|nr:acyl-CoA N-acyltransferase [Mycena epipterygia]
MAHAQHPLTARPRLRQDIVVRQFQLKDAAQVYALLEEGFVYGPESPRNTALQRNLSSPIACAAYAGFSLGLGCLTLAKENHLFQIGGATLCLATATLFVWVRKSITDMFLGVCTTARTTDMGDIIKAYDIPVAAGEPQGPGGFFVAVIESPEHKSSEIVGYVGLDYHTNADPSSAEVRRMIVSMHHRRRGVGSVLMTAVLNHAQRLSPPLTTLDLETTEFQPGPRKMYEKHGFSFVGTRVMRLPAFQMTVLRFRRPLSMDE